MGRWKAHRASGCGSIAHIKRGRFLGEAKASASHLAVKGENRAALSSEMTYLNSVGDSPISEGGPGALSKEKGENAGGRYEGREGGNTQHARSA